MPDISTFQGILMSEIIASIPDGASTKGTAPKSWSARLCLAACLGLFAVIATMMSGFDTVILRALAACLANWRIPAGIVFGVALVVAIGYAMYFFPSLFDKVLLALLAASAPYFWFRLLTAMTYEGVHLVSPPLVSGMIVSSVLFAACASLHFGPVWGRSKLVRLYTGFMVGSCVTLAFTGTMAASALKDSRLKARDDAGLAFAELNKDKEFGAAEPFEMNGYTFYCIASDKLATCR